MEELTPKFETWAVVELFGHTQLAGKVTTEIIASQNFVRIDVPNTDKVPAFTKYHLPTAVYGLTPVGEDYATRMANRLSAQPINNYKHNEVINEIIKEKLQNAQLSLSS